MKAIDLNNWNRRAVFKNFIEYTNPIFSITTKIDVTRLHNHCDYGSFFTDFLFLISKTMNSSQNMKIRLIGKNPVEYEKIDPSFIVKTNNGSISTCRIPYVEDYNTFKKEVEKGIKKTRDEQREEFNSIGDNGVFYVSSIPWIDLLSVENAYDYSDPDSCSIPRITWGKYVLDNGAWKMAINISTHHALVDGHHVAQMIENLQYLIDEQ